MTLIKRLIPVLIAVFPGCVLAFHEAGQYEHELEFQQARSQLERELRQYEQDVQEAMQEFEEKTAHIWGDETKIPNPRQDVTYRNNQSERSIINYEEGSVVVEIAVNLNKSMRKKQLAEQLSQAITDVIVSGPDTRSIIEMAENPDAPPPTDEKNGIVELVADEEGKRLQKHEIQRFSQQQLKRVRRHQLTGRDGIVRYVFTTQFSLVPDHIKVRAEKFRKPVELHAEKFHIPTPLIYAIMETESFFNPYAKSPVPAFGLMQLVPATGARDAYKFLYNKDRLLKESYLYKPEKNIELGVAYMHVIYYKYLHKIQNPKTKLWVMIAAYNTGVINVLKSFMGPYDRNKYGSMYVWKNKAIDKLNKMKPEQVYHFLEKNLPSEETRNYLIRVRERMGKYRA